MVIAKDNRSPNAKNNRSPNINITIPVKGPPNMIPLLCENGGGLQDVVKVVVITNSTKQTIPTATKIFWKASDGDKGDITLTKPLLPGKFIPSSGRRPQDVYTCEAWFFGPTVAPKGRGSKGRAPKRGAPKSRPKVKKA